MNCSSDFPNSDTGATGVDQCYRPVTPGNYYRAMEGDEFSCSKGCYCPGNNIYSNNYGDSIDYIGEFACPTGTTSPVGATSVDQCVDN